MIAPEPLRVVIPAQRGIHGRRAMTLPMQGATVSASRHVTTSDAMPSVVMPSVVTKDTIRVPVRDATLTALVYVQRDLSMTPAGVGASDILGHGFHAARE